MKKISVVIVNWNTCSEIKDCLNSLKKNCDLKSIEVYVVDNNSEDNSVKKISEFKWVKLIQNKENVGFGRANNQVLRQIKTEYVFILNPDTKVEKDTIPVLEKFIIDHEEISLCGPRLINADGSVQEVGYYQKFPSLIQVLFFYTQLSQWSYEQSSLVKMFLTSKQRLEDYFLVDQIPGACMFGKTEVLKEVGFFDESFPLWFEDVDLCFRLKEKGYKLALVPQSRLVHLGGSAFEKWKDTEAKQIRLFKSLFHFFDLHFSLLSKILVRCIIWLDLTLLILRKLMGQLISSNEERRRFIEEKWRVLKQLLVL